MKKIIITTKKKLSKNISSKVLIKDKNKFLIKNKNIKTITILEKKTTNKNKHYNVLKVQSNHKNDTRFKVTNLKNIEHFKNFPNSKDIFVLSNLSQNFNITKGGS